MLLSSCLPLLITFLNVCISYCVGPVVCYKQEPEVLVDPQASSFEETNPGSQQGKPRFILTMS
jgi:hypothetical protein